MAAHQHAHGSSEEQEGLSAAVLELAKGLDAALGVRAVADDRKQSHDSIAAFWKTQLQGLGSWYERGDKYWSRDSVPPTLDGMLGGLAEVSPDDVKESNALLRTLRSTRKSMQWGNAADLGGGIGRICRGVLLSHFTNVDLVEQNAGLVKVAKEAYLADALRGADTPPDTPAVRDIVQAGLQDWAPAAGAFDCIWIQWVAGYVLDPDFVALLRRLVAALAPGGVIVVKENVTFPDSALWMDHEDCSTIRSRPYFEHLFACAGCRIVKQQPQRKWPAGLFPIHVWVLEGQDDTTALASSTPSAEVGGV